MESTIFATATLIYDPPAVVYEAHLEIRAGSPLGLPDLPDIIE